MRVLFIDLASHSIKPNEGASIACVSDAKTESIRFIDHRIGDNSLMPMLNGALNDAGWTEKDLTHIACVTGPGGFTSLRMAVTLANVYSDQLNIPLAGIHMSDVYCARTDVDSFMWLHSTKKSHLFVRGFGEYAASFPEATLLAIEEFIEKADANLPWCGELIPEHREALASKNLQELPLISLADALPSFLTSLTYQTGIIAPWYGRGW